MGFVGREAELRFLDRHHAEHGFRFVPIYGRRRIGKTTLVREFVKDRPAIYFLADTVSEGEQLRNLGREVGEHFGDSLLVENGFRDWQQFFRYLAEKCARKRLVFAIDEFPYLVSANKAISSIFQNGIDTHLKNTELFLILLGSSIGMMEREVLFAKAPLYGRRTGSLEVKELPFRALADFFPGMDFRKRAAIYATVGTLPAYLEKIRPHESILRNIEEQILDRHAFLHNEVEFLLREELREPRDYYVILRAIAQGKRRLSEILNDTGFDKSHASRYLDVLRSIGLVEKETPATEASPEKNRAGLYRLHDRFFGFWFKYVLPNRGKLEIGNTDYVLREIERTLEQHVSQAYEAVARELFLDIARQEEWPVTALGRWWSRTEEIDLVGMDEDSRSIRFGECKWSAKKVGTDIYENLVRKAALVDWHRGNRTERILLFSRSGFTPAMSEIAKRDRVILVEGEERIT